MRIASVGIYVPTGIAFPRKTMPDYEPEPMHCAYCGGELDYEEQPDGTVAYIPHDHVDDSPESIPYMDRPRGDY